MSTRARPRRRARVARAGNGRAIYSSIARARRGARRARHDDASGRRVVVSDPVTRTRRVPPRRAAGAVAGAASRADGADAREEARDRELGFERVDRARRARARRSPARARARTARSLTRGTKPWGRRDAPGRAGTRRGDGAGSNRTSKTGANAIAMIANRGERFGRAVRMGD